ncbi:MAG TPA: hypothetical protein VFY60_00750, partial [Pyrinomonadaceae bacterium]|nr:hypothetical protein [Pyrinomonadaceae bacterium]
AANSTDDRGSLLKRAGEAITEAADLSQNKLKPDSMTMALFYELKSEPDKAAGELEAYLKKNPQLKDPAPIQNEIKRLREKANASKTSP